MRKLILMRHGKSQWQAHRSLQDAFRRGKQTDEEMIKCYVDCYTISDLQTPLLYSPDHDARAVGEWLNNQGTMPNLFAVSPALRAQQTLRDMTHDHEPLQEIEWIVDERLAEQDYGIVDEYGGLRSFLNMFPSEKKRYNDVGMYHYVIPEGESLKQVYVRAADWVEEARAGHPRKFIYVVAHNRIIVCMRKKLEKWNMSDFMRILDKMPPGNCEVAEYRGHRMTLEHFNKKHF